MLNTVCKLMHRVSVEDSVIHFISFSFIYLFQQGQCAKKH